MHNSLQYGFASLQIKGWNLSLSLENFGLVVLTCYGCRTIRKCNLARNLKSIHTTGLVLTCYLQNSNHQVSELAWWKAHQKEKKMLLFTCTWDKNLWTNKHEFYCISSGLNQTTRRSEISIFTANASPSNMNCQTLSFDATEATELKCVFTMLQCGPVISKQGQLCSSVDVWLLILTFILIVAKIVKKQAFVHGCGVI